MTATAAADRAISLMLSSSLPPERSLDAARRAEAAGFGRVWITEDYYRKGAFATAGAVLASTAGLRVALGVASVYARGLPVLAMETATTARMFPGRFELGIGSGSMRALRHLGRVPERLIGSLRHRLDGLRALLDGATIDWSDEFETLSESALTFPIGRPPIWVAAEAPQMLRLAARSADGLILSSLSSPGYVRWAAERYAETIAERSGPLPVTAFAYVSLAADDDIAYRRAADYLAARLANSYGPSVLRQSGHWAFLETLIGRDPAEIVRELTPELVGEYVPFGSGLGDRFEALFAAGVTEIAAAPISAGELDTAIGGIAAIADRIGS